MMIMKKEEVNSINLMLNGSCCMSRLISASSRAHLLFTTLLSFLRIYFISVSLESGEGEEVLRKATKNAEI